MIEGTTVIVELRVLVTVVPSVSIDGGFTSRSEWVDPRRGLKHLTFTQVPPGQHTLLAVDTLGHLEDTLGHLVSRTFRTLMPTATATPTPAPTPTATPTANGTQDTSGVVFTITIDPSEPSVGSAVRVTAYASAPGGVPQYTLLITTNSTERWEPSGIFIFESPSSVSVSQLEVPVNWDLNTVQAGEATLQVLVNYEKEYCAPTHCFYGFTNASSDIVKVSVRERLP